MFSLAKLVVFVWSASTVFGASLLEARDATAEAAAAGVSVAGFSAPRPVLPVPSLTQIRDILSQMEAPIVSCLTERLNVKTDISAYGSSGSKLLAFMLPQEVLAAASGRFDYGKLEYPFTLPIVSPDHVTKQTPFPPGQFHQDTFTPNQELFQFWIQTLVPLFQRFQGSSVFYHLDNSTIDDNAMFTLDSVCLGLLSARASISKVVAETKYASNVTGFTPLIHAQDSTTIRVLLTNTTQEASVLTQAASAASSFSTAWLGAGALEGSTFPANLANITFTVFRRLIDITTDGEVDYLLQRFD